MEEGKFITSDELKVKRITGHRIQLGGGFIVDDRLEAEGTLRISECIGGCLYLEPGSLFLEDAPVVAGILISKSGNSLMLREVFCEHGHEELIPLLVSQIMHFADFYGYNCCFSGFEAEWWQSHNAGQEHMQMNPGCHAQAGTAAH